MKYLFIILVFAVTGCGLQKDTYTPPENALDAGREFIDACLKGDFKKAAFYVIKNETAGQLLKQIENKYNGKTPEQKKQLSSASINISNIEELPQKETIIHYSNSFDKTEQVIKVINTNGEWLVELTYSADKK